MKLTKKFNVKDFYKDYLPLSHQVTNILYDELYEADPNRYEALMELHNQCFDANFSRRKSKAGESSLNSILADMLDSEISKSACKALSERNELANQLLLAYRQNKEIAKYLDCSDVFAISKIYNEKLNYVVDKLYSSKMTFEQVVAVALNYAQFSTIYAFDSELGSPKPREKRYTNFERELVSQTLFYALEAMDVMLEMGQSAYVALCGGRSVCTGQAIMTAGIIDLAFKKLGIEGSAKMVSNSTHAFVLVEHDNKKYVVDPTQYFGTFKEIKQNDKINATFIKNAEILKLKKYDSDAHFKVVNYFLDELNMQKEFENFIKFDDVVPVKLAKIVAHIEANLSKMSELIYPKGVFVGNREFELPFYFELCLNASNILYKTGCGTQDFIVYDNNSMYYIDTQKMFDAKNKLKTADKFMRIKDCKIVNEVDKC